MASSSAKRVINSRVIPRTLKKYPRESEISRIVRRLLENRATRWFSVEEKRLEGKRRARVHHIFLRGRAKRGWKNLEARGLGCAITSSRDKGNAIRRWTTKFPDLAISTRFYFLSRVDRPLNLLPHSQPRGFPGLANRPSLRFRRATNRNWTSRDCEIEIAFSVETVCWEQEMFRNGKSMEQEEEREQRFFIRIIFCGGRF